MKYVVMPKRANEIDKYMIETLSIPSVILMEQAACGIADTVCELGGKKVIVLCGKGNNGGDGYAAARILLTRGYDVYIGAVGDAYTDDAKLNAALLKKLGRAVIIDKDSDFMKRHSDADIIVDALFGTGLTRTPEGVYAKLIDEINTSSAKVVAADIPSGIYGSNGQGEKAVKADITVTFQYAKPGHFIYPGREHTGKLIVKTIGTNEGLIPSDMFFIDSCSLEKRQNNTNKGSFGKLSIIAGKKGMAGAAVLCARASVAAGSGLTRVGTTEFCMNILQSSVPEATTVQLGKEHIEPIKAAEFIDGTAAIGPGLGTGSEIAETLKLILPLDIPKVVDADALNVIAEHPELKSLLKGALITPHPKEFSRLTGKNTSEILSDPVSAVKDFADKTGATVLLKGATTVISDGEKTAFVTAGSPAMAKGGSGDVLTGVAGSLIAQGHAPFEAAYMAAYFCGKAGEKAALKKGTYSVSPLDTIANLYME